jgi:uncharacterized protein (DUF305 family)
MNTNQKPITTILFSYLSYLALFVGTAFISGAIVHSGNISEIPKYIVIGLIGLTLFVAGSFVQETIINKNSLQGTKLVKFLFFSLLLSVGIGMISGGVQHFTDFPVYSSFLIPLGVLLSLVAFLLKNSYSISSKVWVLILSVFALLSLILNIGLGAYANSLVKKVPEYCETKASFLAVKVNASGTHAEDCIKPAQNNSMTMDMSNNSKVKDDRSFIDYVIPHHQDAVDGSQELLKISKDPELISFLNNVIATQTKEIDLLKRYYKSWFGAEYKDSYIKLQNRYFGMNELEASKTFTQNMLAHHSGIIDVAKKVVASDIGYSYKPEIVELSQQIIKDQEADNVVLNNWLGAKYKTVEITKTNSDDHSGH